MITRDNFFLLCKVTAIVCALCAQKENLFVFFLKKLPETAFRVSSRAV